MDMVFNKLQSVYFSKKELFNTTLIMLYGFAFMKSVMDHNMVLMWSLVYIPTLFYVWHNIDTIKKSFFKWKRILFSFGILFTVGKILADKAFNERFEIEAQYLQYSSNIMAVIYAIVFGVSIIFLIHLIPHLLRLMVYSVIGEFSTKYRKKLTTLGFFFKLIILIGLATPFFTLAEYAEKPAAPYYLLADAYAVSDCGPKVDGTLYLRKNNQACYAIQGVIKPIFKTIESPTSK